MICDKYISCTIVIFFFFFAMARIPGQQIGHALRGRDGIFSLPYPPQQHLAIMGSCEFMQVLFILLFMLIS